MSINAKTDGKITADIVLSIGVACRSAKQLKTANLRKYAFPLDWMMNYDMQSVVYHFQTDFADFFKNKAIEGQEQSKNYTKLRVRDTDTKMLSIHHFTADLDLEEQYAKKFLPAMLKRYHFVKKIMRNARHIVLVSHRQEDTNVFVGFLQEMHQLFPCKITLLNVRHDDKSERYDEKQVNDYMTVKEIKINDDLKVVEYSFDDRCHDELSSWVGNTPKWQEMLAGYQLSWKTRLKALFKSKRRNIK